MRRWWLELGSFVVALALAAAVVLRWRSGQVALLSSAAAPAIRLLALLIVFVQGCADKLRGREAPGGEGAQTGAAGARPAAGEERPVSEDMSEQEGPSQHVQEDMSSGTASLDGLPLTDDYRLGLCAINLAAGDGMARALLAVPVGAPPESPEWQEVMRAVGAAEAHGDGGSRFRGAWSEHVEGRKAGRADTLAGLSALLSATEAAPMFHAGVAAYVWRRAAPLAASATERAALLARIERHLRASQAVRRGLFEAGPIQFTAWRSKAAPPGGWTGTRVPDGLADAIRRHHPGSDAGTWESEGTIELTVVDEGMRLLRAGQAEPLQPGRLLILRRLDVVQADRPATLRHDVLGDMSIGSGDVLTAWDLGGRLGEAGRALVRKRVAEARGGNARALAELEAILPAAHAEIRRALAEQPRASGSPGLRMLLALFDE